MGSSPFVHVQLGNSGPPIKFLIDTGSQVSTITEELYEEVISSQAQKRPLRKLDLRAANGLSLPYSGYVILDLVINGKVLKDKGLLIVKEPVGRRAPGVLGMNVLDSFPELFQVMGGGPIGIETLMVSDNLLEQNSLRDSNSGKRTKIKSCFAKVAGNSDVNILAESCRTIAVYRAGSDTEPAVFEPMIGLPRGLMILPTYTETKRFQVMVFNHSSEDVWLRPNVKLGVINPGCVKNFVRLQVSQDELTVEIGADNKSASPIPETVDTLIDGVNASPEQKQLFRGILVAHQGAFAASEFDLGCTNLTSHRIVTTDNIPVTAPYRRVPPHELQTLKEHLQKLLEAGVIQESNSPYSAPVVIVHKRRGGIRLCVDYRALNAKSIRAAHPLPRIDESIDALRGSRFFSVLDLKSAYHQLPMHSDSQEKTAFTTPFGLFEYCRMPFGLSGAPASFQALMDNTFRDDLYQIMMCYLDDIVVFSETFEEHVVRLGTVLQRLEDAGLKVELSKCEFFKERVVFLGHEISARGVAVDPEKIAAVENWPKPQVLREVRKFLGFTGYVRRHIENYTKIARPLQRLVAIAGEHGGKRNKRLNIVKYWTEACEEAFHNLIDKLINAPVLAYPDYTKEFIVTTDACETGIAATLSQTDDTGEKRIVAYASRALRKGESNKSNYSSAKLELLALKWAVTEAFRDYLLTKPFTVYTDSNALTYLMSKKRLTALEARWVNALSLFDFRIKFLPGRKNVAADILSRLPQPVDAEKEEELSSCIDDLAETTALPIDLVARVAIDELSVVTEENSQSNVRSDHPEPFNREATYIPCLPREELGQLQQQDESMARLIHYRQLGRRPNHAERQTETKDVLRYVKEWDRISEDRGVLFRSVVDENNNRINQVLLPTVLRDEILTQMHEHSAHQGQQRTEANIRARAYWPTIAEDVRHFIEKCERCSLSKLPYRRIKTPLGRLTATRPLEVVAIDFTEIEESKGRGGPYRYVLVMTDVMTKLAITVPTRDQKADTVAKCLVQHLFRVYGPPQRLHSDNGRSFEGKVIRKLCELYNIRKSRITAYHPPGNGQCERYNRSLHDMLRTLVLREKRRWAEHLQTVTFQYNRSVHASTGQTPFYLMFGREPRTPVDALLGSAVESSGQDNWVTVHQKRLRQARDFAQARTQTRADERKHRHDQNAKPHILPIGSHVMIRKRRLGMDKIGDSWDSRLWVIVESRPNAVYVIQPEDGFGKCKTVTRAEIKPSSRPVWRPSFPDREGNGRDQRDRRVRGTSSSSDSGTEVERNAYYRIRHNADQPRRQDSTEPPVLHDERQHSSGSYHSRSPPELGPPHLPTQRREPDRPGNHGNRGERNSDHSNSNQGDSPNHDNRRNHADNRNMDNVDNDTSDGDGDPNNGAAGLNEPSDIETSDSDNSQIVGIPRRRRSARLGYDPNSGREPRAVLQNKRK